MVQQLKHEQIQMFMKYFFNRILVCTGFSAFLLQCSHDNAFVPANTMHAQVNLMEFNSSGRDIVVAFPVNPSDSSKTELVISGATGNPSNQKFLLIQIFDYDKNNGSGTYVFDSLKATGLYSPGSGIEDFFVSGSVIITASGNTIAGTFAATTQSGISITKGDFSVVH
jgi:hypothetical protein